MGLAQAWAQGPRGARGAQGGPRGAQGGPRGGQGGPRKDPRKDPKKFRSTLGPEFKNGHFRVKKRSISGFSRPKFVSEKNKRKKDTKVQPQVEKRDEPNFSHTDAQNILLVGIFLFLDSLQPHFGSKSGLEGLRPRVGRLPAASGAQGPGGPGGPRAQGPVAGISAQGRTHAPSFAFIG